MLLEALGDAPGPPPVCSFGGSFFVFFGELSSTQESVTDGDKMTTIRVSGLQEGTSRRINPFPDFSLSQERISTQLVQPVPTVCPLLWDQILKETRLAELPAQA